MFIAKFIVPVIRNIHTDIPKFSFRDNRFGSKDFCKTVEDAKKTTVSSKCKEYQDKLAKCPKPSRKSLCRKTKSSKSLAECKTQTVVDDYKRVHQDVMNQAKSILKGFHAESKVLLDQLKKDIEISKNYEERQLQEFSNDIKKKVQKLLVLDPSFGSFKRKSALSLNHQLQEAFNNLQCEIVPQVKRVKYILDSVERDLLTCIDRARSLILSCRKCRTPQAFARCVEENAIYADKILDKTAQNARTGLNRVETLKREILDYHKSAMVEAMKTYQKERDTFLEHLDDCISVAKNKKKR